MKRWEINQAWRPQSDSPHARIVCNSLLHWCYLSILATVCPKLCSIVFTIAPNCQITDHNKSGRPSLAEYKHWSFGNRNNRGGFRHFDSNVFWNCVTLFLQSHQETLRWCPRTLPLPSETLKHRALWIPLCIRSAKWTVVRPSSFDGWLQTLVLLSWHPTLESSSICSTIYPLRHWFLVSSSFLE